MTHESDNEIKGVKRRSMLTLAAVGAVAAVAGLDAELNGAAEAKEWKGGVPAMVRVTVPQGALKVEQVQAIVSGVAKVIADVTGVGPTGMPFVTVVVMETVQGGWGVAGHGYINSELPGLVAGHKL